MTFTEKRLAQSYPNATTNTTAYTTPVLTKTIVRNITICNTTANPINARVFIVPNGGAAGVSNALYYDHEIQGNLTYNKNLYLILDTAGDTIVVYASAQGITFTISGAEIV